MKRLDDIRKEINTIDKEILALLERRYACSQDVATVKQDSNTPTYRVDREQEIIQQLNQQKNNTMPSISHIYLEIMSLSRTTQPPFVISVAVDQEDSARLGATLIFGSHATIEVIGASSGKRPSTLLLSQEELTEEHLEYVEQCSFTSAVVYHIPSLESYYILFSSVLDATTFTGSIDFDNDSQILYYDDKKKGKILAYHAIIE